MFPAPAIVVVLLPPPHPVNNKANTTLKSVNKKTRFIGPPSILSFYGIQASGVLSVEYKKPVPDRGAIPSGDRSLVHARSFPETADLRRAISREDSGKKQPWPGSQKCFSKDCTFLYQAGPTQGYLELTVKN
jgi:hypothetical protein